MIPQTHEALIERLAEVSRSWLRLRAEHQEGNYRYEQAQHWFYCLSWASGFEATRGDGEAIGDFIGRAAQLRPPSAVE